MAWAIRPAWLAEKIFGWPPYLPDRYWSDYVLLVGGDHSEWNIPYFGSDPSDGAEVIDWIRKNYQEVLVIGHEPLRDPQFGLEFLKHTSSPASAAVIAPNH